MRIRRIYLFELVLILLSMVDDRAEMKNPGDPNFKNQENSISKNISTTLKIKDDDVKNSTNKVREIVTTEGSSFCSKAMKVPEKREQISEVIPIIRSMSPPQKLIMATLISKRISNDNSTSPPLEEVRSLFSNRNRENATRELMLPISIDIAKILTDDISEEEMIEEDEETEELPQAQELRSARPIARGHPIYRPTSSVLPLKRPVSLNRRNVYADSLRKSALRPSRRPTEPKRGPTDKECTFFTKTVCLEAVDYPHEAILRSLRNNKDMVAALLTDYKVHNHGRIGEKLPFTLSYENPYENRYESNEIKRSDNSFDNVEEGFTCPSIVKYARPQLARAASGMWKYIINTGEHTQTLRMEKCSSSQSSCSFISENYRSSCVQVYNYHRLLTWDSKLGLHMDIFKVPTCCSCHVHGYAEIFPPHQKDPPSKPKETFPGIDFSTNHDQKDEYQDLSRPNTNYISKYNPTTNYDSGLAASNKKPVLEESSSRPSFSLPGRMRPKKPSPILRPYDKLPQQHAPNTRAPGYTGPLIKGTRSKRPNRPPYRRESMTQGTEDHTESPSNSSYNNRYSQSSQSYDQEMDASTRLQNGGFDEEYQEPQRRINYNYHPIIDFFKPEASMLQSSESQTQQFGSQSDTVQRDSNSWKPMIAS